MNSSACGDQPLRVEEGGANPPAFRQVITIDKDGVVSGLERRDGFSLVNFARREGAKSVVVKRATEILWDEESCAWTVAFPQPRAHVLSGGPDKVTLYEAESVLGGNLSQHPILNLNRCLDEPILFADYDQAVRFEIAFLDAMTLGGR